MALNQAAERLGVSLRQTEDELTRNMLAATAAAINCTGGVNGDNPTEITRVDVNDVVRTLLNNNAELITLRSKITKLEAENVVLEDKHININEWLIENKATDISSFQKEIKRIQCNHLLYI